MRQTDERPACHRYIVSDAALETLTSRGVEWMAVVCAHEADVRRGGVSCQESGRRGAGYP